MTSDDLHDTANDLKQDASAMREESERATREAMPDLEQKARRGAASVVSVAEKTPNSAYLAALAGSAVVSGLLLARNHKGTALLIGFGPAILSLAMLMKNRRPSHEVAQSTPLGSADGALLAE